MHDEQRQPYRLGFSKLLSDEHPDYVVWKPTYNSNKLLVFYDHFQQIDFRINGMVFCSNFEHAGRVSYKCSLLSYSLRPHRPTMRQHLQLLWSRSLCVTNRKPNAPSDILANSRRGISGYYNTPSQRLDGHSVHCALCSISAGQRGASDRCESHQVIACGLPQHGIGWKYPVKL